VGLFAFPVAAILLMITERLKWEILLAGSYCRSCTAFEKFINGSKEYATKQYYSGNQIDKNWIIGGV
jgi:hypothetical protein